MTAKIITQYIIITVKEFPPKAPAGAACCAACAAPSTTGTAVSPLDGMIGVATSNKNKFMLHSPYLSINFI